MADRFWTSVLLLVLAACSAAASAILGTWPLGMSVVILLLLTEHVLAGKRGGSWWGWAAVLLGLLGGLVAISSALAALVTTGNVADGSARAGFGWAALVLAVIATVGATLARARPRLASVALVAGSSVGLLAMSLFDINTLYIAALPLCWIAAALVMLDARPPATRALAHE